MLREYAFTPHIFDADAHSDLDQWQRQLHAVLQDLKKIGDPCCVVISGMQTSDGWCAWLEQATRLMKEIPNGIAARTEARYLLQKMKELCVDRLPIRDWVPEDDEQWLSEARQTHEKEPLHRIVTFGPCTANEGAPVVAFRDIDKEEFWDGCTITTIPHGDMASYAAVLRPIVLHSTFLHLSMPYQSEMEFAWHLLSHLKSRAVEVVERRVWLHFEGTAGGKFKEHARGKMKDHEESTKIACVFWPKSEIGERLILGGKLSDVGGGSMMSSIRWGVHMGHVQRQGEVKRPMATQWTLRPLLQCQDDLEYFEHGMKRKDVKVVEVWP